MLIFGGISTRERYINGTDLTIFDRCEYYDTKFDIEPENRPFSYRNCAEEILGDLWRYHIRRNVWTYIKLDYGPTQSSVVAPYARYQHASCQIELSNPEETMNIDGIVYTRKFLYVYGGFAYKC